MPANFPQWVGRVVDNDLPLTEHLVSATNTAVFQTTFSGQKAAIKLFVTDPAGTDAQLARLQSAEKLSHPHLLRILKTGRAELDDIEFLYVVMEFADENLAQVLPERALTPQESREVLQSTLDALAYLHAEGFVHSALKPANILASNDQLKLSIDSVTRKGENLARPGGPHDAPEAQQSPSPASDIWSLGMTLVEILTQHLPDWQPASATGPAVPESVPAPFREIAQHCLLRTPELRWSIAEISSKLNPPAETPAATPVPELPAATAYPRSSRRPLILLAIIAIIVVAIVVFQRHQTTNPEQSSPSASTQAPQPTPETSPTPPPPEPRPAETRSTSAPTPTAATANNEPAQAEAVPSDEAVHQVLPTIIPKAQNSIQGKFRVRLRVEVDSSGNVVSSKLVSPGPSRYFANASIEAARRWNFPPSSAESRSYTLEFEFRRSGNQAHFTPIK